MTDTTPPPFAWTPTDDQIRSSRIRQFLDRHGITDLAELEDRVAADPEWFWTAAVDDIGIGWHQRFERTIDTESGLPWARFWVGGRLNVATNAVDRHAAVRPNDVAVIWEGDDGSTRAWRWEELEAEVAAAAGGLAGLGVGPGDCVGLCLPMLPETVALFMACSKLGAIVAPLFSGYGAAAIASRLNDCGAKVLCVADGFTRRGKTIELKRIADEAVEAVPSIRHTVVVRRLGLAPDMREGRDHWYDDVTSSQPTEWPTHDTSADDPFMLIYTSGTTGRPKGTVHVQGGFAIKATQDMAHCFDVRDGDRVLWYTDIGWMMGPWVIIGALTLGATLVLFDGLPDHPGPDRLWDVVQRHEVTVLGLAPTVVRALMRHGDDPVRTHDLTSLRVLGSSGEPWNEGPWSWFLRVVGGGRCPIINYSGGTEISGGILGCTMLRPLRPGAFSGPCPGMQADVVDDEGRSLRGAVGELVVRAPWPGMTRGFWNDRERYLESYWSRIDNVWVHGDWAEIDADGQWYIRGRSDDTIKVAGKRLGPAEAESAAVQHPAVAEAAAIGVPDALKGEALVVFIVARPGNQDPDTLAGEVRARIADTLGRALAPERVEILPELPKTRNAKVLRRVLRAVYLGLDPGDLSSLDNRQSLDAIAAVRRRDAPVRFE